MSNVQVTCNIQKININFKYIFLLLLFSDHLHFCLLLLFTYFTFLFFYYIFFFLLYNFYLILPIISIIYMYLSIALNRLQFLYNIHFIFNFSLSKYLNWLFVSYCTLISFYFYPVCYPYSFSFLNSIFFLYCFVFLIFPSFFFHFSQFRIFPFILSNSSLQIE